MNEKAIEAAAKALYAAMTDEEFNDQLDKLNDHRLAARRDLCIQRYGSCPKYKGHFDFGSFLCGLFTAATAVVVVSLAAGIISGVIR